MKKKLLLIILVIAFALIFVSCKQFDVIGYTSIKSFDAVLDAIPANIAEDKINNAWSLNAPDGSARFIWSKDFSQSPFYDIMIEFDAQPFIDAGLDISRLPEGMEFAGSIIVGAKLGTEILTYDGDANPLASFEKIVELKRESIKYHAPMDHYGVDLTGGNMFEWAKDMSINDKDVVFVLNPQAFIDAGVDPAKLEGWVLAKVPVMDENNKPIEADKFLKPFNLK
ncbi:MAG: hypothetical protein ACYCWE_16620 [Eubacteriales bacterium]